jgi:hypothetical protein
MFELQISDVAKSVLKKIFSSEYKTFERISDALDEIEIDTSNIKKCKDLKIFFAKESDAGESCSLSRKN